MKRTNAAKEKIIDEILMRMAKVYIYESGMYNIARRGLRKMSFEELDAITMMIITSIKEPN